jgi:hypothetical protein
MQSVRPSTIDKQTVEEIQHLNWLNNGHTQLILQKIKDLASHYNEEAKSCSESFDSSTNGLMQLKLKLNKALTTTEIIKYVQNNSFPIANA